MTGIIQEVVYKNPDMLPPMVNELRLLDDAGYRVDVLCCDYHRSPDVTYPPAVHMRSVASSGSSWRRLAHFIRNAFAESGPRIAVYVGHDMHGFLVARLLAWRYRRPVIYRCHDLADRSVAVTPGVRVVRAFESLFARTADVVVVPDRDRADAIEAILHLKRKPVVVANAPIAAPGGSCTALSDALRERGHHFEKILFRQGATVQHHAIEATIRSIPLWNNKNWGFVLMGWTRSEFEREILELADRLGVREQIVHLPPVGYDRVASFTIGADVGHALYEPAHINNRLIGTASNKTMEYLAAGLPVLAGDTPEMRRLFEGTVSAEFADPASPGDIARAVNTLLGDDTLLRRLQAGARRAFEERFRFDRQFAPLLSEIDRLVGATRDEVTSPVEALP